MKQIFELNDEIAELFIKVEEAMAAAAATTSSSSKRADQEPTKQAPTHRFEPKSNLFNQLLADYIQPELKKQRPLEPDALVKLANLFNNYEGYYSAMLAPFEDTFGAETGFESDESSLPPKPAASGCKRMRQASEDGCGDEDEAINDDAGDEMAREDDDHLNTSANSAGHSVSSSVSSSMRSLTSINSNNERTANFCKPEFHLCAFCGHCLLEPVTLTCGCTFCKPCLIEYNQQRRREGSELTANRTIKRKLTSINESSGSVLRCFTCARSHEHNSLEYLRPNVMVTKLVDRFWHHNIEIRRLRNDIRAYVCFCIEDAADIFDVTKFEYLLNSAYTLDPSNHLILADLFILNYFYDCNPTCLKYAQMACDLRPNWAFAYFMKAVYYEHEGDLANLKTSLLTCLQLEPNIETVRIKLYQIFQMSNLTSRGSHRKPVTGFHFEQPPESITPESIQFEKMVNKIEKSSLNFDYSKYVTIDSQLVKPVDLECSLCYRLLYHPVTTPCGHSFCLKCLERALDHRDQCPLCKHSLADYLAERRQFVTSFIDKLIRAHYQPEHVERKRQHRDEIVELLGDENEISVFVCTLALPFAPCPLHIYEPRYRLMVRRAMESGRRAFGMVMYTEKTPYRYAEYGCLLDIQSCQFLRDGRSILTTVGSKRFRVLEPGARDGYNIAKVEWVKDVRVEDEAEKAELLQLHDEVYRLAHHWYSFIPETQKNRIMEIYGISELPLPEADIQTDNGPYWHWFLLNILPLDRDFQYKFLCKTSLKERLKQMKKIILILMAPMRNLITTGQSTSDATDSSSTSSHSDARSTQTGSTENQAQSVASSEISQNPSASRSSNEPSSSPPSSSSSSSAQ